MKNKKFCDELIAYFSLNTIWMFDEVERNL
jgi:hypothetical protein